MLKRLMLMVVVMSTLLAGCAIAPNQSGQFGTVPVEATSFTIYQCSATKENFTRFQPQLGSLQLQPYSATVIDNGAGWVATYPDGKVESPQLYKDLLGKIDGAVDLSTGARYYRIHALGARAPVFSTSTVNPNTGDGIGMTFLQCVLAPDSGESLVK
ncbi:hypothetical protein BIZ83_gp117 [Erwinia phage vB_EamM_ChrisDB]|uniref:hypothetical protein n=1 Tax=Erwinia phage vB_EamM_ChrisDB TaxID=1883371 RepID=UPI00081D2443|nr:hypothetical protein BIZ83_gp117 [Erwinia phage vB_EamM_ChrisDB]ANZ48736.1 hypothetical protein CHRISDB_174 [Erwinia phage vB_EamM_ChrisDB]